METQSNKNLAVSDSQQYGVWFPKYAKKTLVKGEYFGVMAESGVSSGKGAKALNWIERDYGNGKENILSFVSGTDYNPHVQNFNKYDRSNYATGSWTGVDYVAGSGEIISEAVENRGGYTLYHVLSSHKYKVNKSGTFDKSYIGEEVDRRYYHLVVSKNNMGFLEFFRPDHKNLPPGAVITTGTSDDPKSPVLERYFNKNVEISNKAIN